MTSLKRFIHRSKAGFAEKFGKAEKTIDEEYDFLFRRFEQISNATINYNKHVQQFIENFHSMSTTLTFIAEDMTDLYKNSPDESKKIMADRVMQVAQDIEITAVKPFQDDVVSKVVNPLNTYIETFEHAKQLHKQRGQILQEHDYYKTKIKKLTEKQSKDPMKLPQNKEKYRQKKEDLEKITTTTREKFVEIIEEQPRVFDNITGITLTSLLIYWERVHSTLNVLQSYTTQEGTTVTTTSFVEKKPLIAKNSFTKPVKDFTDVNLRPLPVKPPSAALISKGEPLPGKFKCEWYYLDSSLNQTGPLSYTTLKTKYNNEELNDQTFVFGSADLNDWKAIGDYTELKRCLSDISSS